MKVDKYHLKADSKFIRFEFISEGPKGNIRKLIEFQETNVTGIFNLAFGDLKGNSENLDDLSISNNDDTEKILATVVSAVYAFFDKYPTVYVYATGSTKARTRLYRIGITKFHEEMKNDFYLYGQLDNEFVTFEVGIEYKAFLAQRKF